MCAWAACKTGARFSFIDRIKEVGAGSTSAEVASCEHVTHFKALAIWGMCGGARQFENNFKTKLKL